MNTSITHHRSAESFVLLRLAKANPAETGVRNA